MLSKFIPLLLAGKALADVTVTKTNYITPPCFEYELSTIFSESVQLQPRATGVEVVFVYDDGSRPNSQPTVAVGTPSPVAAGPADSAAAAPPATFVTTSDVVYSVNTHTPSTQLVTSCSNGKCSVSASSTNVPVQYTFSTHVSYTTTVDTATASPTTTTILTSASPSTAIVDSTSTSTTSTAVSAKATITKSAPTTTSTIFSASVTPKTNSTTPVTTQTVATTLRNPVSSQSVVSSSQSVVIPTSKFSSALTLSGPTYSATNTSGSGSGSGSAPAAGSSTTFSTTSVGSITTGVNTHVLSNSTGPIVALPSYGNSTREAAPATSSNSSSSTIVAGTNNTLPSAIATVSSGFSNISTSVPTSNSSIVTHPGSSLLPTSGTTSPENESAPSPPPPSPGSGNGFTGNLFDAIDSSKPPSVFARDALPLGIPAGVDNGDVPYETNKFYANLFLDAQTDMIWSYPYGLYWLKKNYYGFGVQHSNASARIFGTTDTNNPKDASYYFNPTNDAELIVSAKELTSNNNFMSVSQGKDMSVLVQLSPNQSPGSDYIELPIVLGMGFVTSIYHGGLTPVLNSLEGVGKLAQESSSALPSNTLKFRATLFNGIQWLIYVTIPSSSKISVSSFTFDVTTPYVLTGSESIDGLIIQLAVAPSDSSKDGFYDEAAGLYATESTVEGSVVDGTQAIYSFNYKTSGSSSSGKTILFAFPHHVESMTSASSEGSTGITLDSTTKGTMNAYLANSLSFAETLQTDIQFLPWSQTMTSPLSYTADQLTMLAQAANKELAVDIPSTVAGMDSNYFSGKVLDKYAYILLVVNDIIQDETVAKSTLDDLKKAFEPFINNKQFYPLMYDTKFGGITSTASQGGDTGADYGSGYYNDHHFHYGYFVHAAAIVGYVDQKYGGTWAQDNKEWVNSLVRDVANPSEDDTYFPVSRMFDWFAGHSWAAGLFASGDGKNEESTSEDYNFSYGMKLWGKVIGDKSMESRGDLMLAVQARSSNSYFLYSDDNTIEPAQIIGNKVSGIFFENKVDYTTYFGTPETNPEYVHGIHMLPITPASSLIRGPTFVKQEWDQQVSTFIDNVKSGWTGILYLNQAFYDPSSSYDFFSSSSFSTNYLDNGQSLTWSLAYSGGIANAK